MDRGFGGRLKAAMLAAGLSTAAQLAERCGAPRSTVDRWLAMDEADLSAKRLHAVAECLHVRMRWLVSGVGVSGWQPEDEAHVEAALVILQQLAPARAREWLDIGRAMART